MSSSIDNLSDLELSNSIDQDLTPFELAPASVVPAPPISQKPAPIHDLRSGPDHRLREGQFALGELQNQKQRPLQIQVPGLE